MTTKKRNSWKRNIASAEIIFPKQVPMAMIKPKGLLTKLLWKWIQLDVKVSMGKGLIHGLINKETSFWNLIPKEKWSKK